MSTAQDASTPTFLRWVGQVLSGPICHDAAVDHSSFSISEALERVLKHLESDDWSPRWERALSTGFWELDAHSGGFEPADLWVLGGRPGMGKSVVMWKMVENGCLEEGAAVMVVTRDGPLEDLVWRLILSRAGQTPEVEEAPADTRDTLRRAMKAAAEEIRTAPLFIKSRAIVPLGELCDDIRSMREHKDLRLVAIDGFSVLKGSDAGLVLKELARELHLAIVVTCGVTQKAENPATDYTPLMDHLADRRQLAEAADKVVMLVRPEYYAASEEEKESFRNQLRVVAVRNRRRLTGELMLDFEGHSGKVRSFHAPSWNVNFFGD